jgi:ABC-type transport system substrate-binding protein
MGQAAAQSQQRRQCAVRPAAEAAIVDTRLPSGACRLDARGAFGADRPAASAKTLVYCSEGSPEGFDPALYTSGTTFDASSKPIYNRLVEFKRGTTEVQPRPRRELGSLR